MVERIAINLVARLEGYSLIDSSNGEYYEYALITLIERTITVISILLLGMFFHRIFPTTCFLIFFLSLRKRTGGYHADKFWLCYLETIMIYVLVVLAAEKLVDWQTLMYVMVICSFVLIGLIGTVNHPNMDMNAGELREAKKAARITAFLEAEIILALILLEADRLYINYMMIAVILCAVMLGLAKIIKQEVKKDEKEES